MDTLEFFTTLFAEKAPHTQILVWTLPDKASRLFTDAERAAAYAALPANRQKNVYVGVGTRAETPEKGKRGGSSSVAELFGLWADIDVAGPGHKKENLPPTIDDALEILASLPKEPSIVLHSGGGLQAYWLFESPVPPSPQILSLVYGWQCHIQTVAQSLGGWEVDSVHDAARVLRVPGTLNLKTDPPAEVTVLSADDVRYSPEEFLPWTKEPPTNKPSKKTIQFTFKPETASPPFDKWEALKSLNPKVKATWDRKRKDLKDSSASGYDMSLCMFAVAAGWTDQEMVDLLLACHRTHGEPPKSEHYYAATIAKARANYSQDESQAIIDEHVMSYSSDEPLDDDEATKIRNHVSNRLGVRILHVYKYLSDPAQYRIEFEGGSIYIGEAKNLLSQATIRCAIVDAAGKVMPTFTDAMWRGICQALVNIREDVPIGEEATDAGSIIGWLHEYLEDRPPADPIPELLKARCPLVRNGAVYIFIRHFSTWLHTKYAEKISAKVLGGLLRHAGASVDTLYIPTENGSTTTTAWRLPDTFNRHIPASSGHTSD